MQSIDVVPAVSGNVVSTQLEDPLRRAVAAYLSRFKDGHGFTASPTSAPS